MEQHFGKYQLLRRIGAGGFGVVYEGYDPSIRRRVAIKTCNSVDPRVRLRFAREAEVNGNLAHPNIVVVFDYGEFEDKPYLVQEFLTGEDLDVKIDRGERIPLATKVNYLIQIAEGLSHAHSKGVVHRDVKPANVRVLDNGVVKVMDFGIAWIKNDASITLTGRTVGTAAYMAPEQLRNEPAGPQADIFSFGVLAYELLTGTRAFAGDSASQILYQVLNSEPPPIRSRCPDVPAELAALIAGCHRKDPEERYHDLDSLIPAFRYLERQTAGLDTAGLPIPSLLTNPSLSPLPRRSPDAAGRQAAGSSEERTITLEPPTPPPAEQAAELDNIDLRGRARRPATLIPVAGAASAGRGRRWPLAPLAAALAVLALLAVAALRFDVIDRWWPSPEVETDVDSADIASAETDGPVPGSTQRASDAPAEPVAATPTTSSPPRTTAPPAAPERSPGPAAQQAQDPVPTPTPAEHASPSPPAEAPAVAADAPRRPRPVGPRGALSVRTALGSPQVWAWLDDKSLGRTPIRRAVVAPGRHRLRIALAPAVDAAAPSWEVRVAGGQELILTLDPASGAAPREVRRPLVD